MDYNTRSAHAIGEGNCVGQIQKIFGKEGELVLKIWDNFPEDLSSEPLWIEIDSKGVPLFIKSCRQQGASKLVVVFEDWDSEDLAKELVGKNIFFELEEDDQAGANMLQGWTLLDKSTGRRGEIVDNNDSEINPLLFVVIDGHECMIPLAEEYIVAVDENSRVIEVDLPEGLLDLY